MCVPRRTMYRQRSAYQLVLPKVKKKKKKKKKKTLEQQIHHSIKSKVILTNLQMTQAKETVEPNYSCPPKQ